MGVRLAAGAVVSVGEGLGSGEWTRVGVSGATVNVGVRGEAASAGSGDGDVTAGVEGTNGVNVGQGVRVANCAMPEEVPKRAQEQARAVKASAMTSHPLHRRDNGKGDGSRCQRRISDCPEIPLRRCINETPTRPTATRTASPRRQRSAQNQSNVFALSAKDTTSISKSSRCGRGGGI